jgi:hypothetical protein
VLRHWCMPFTLFLHCRYIGFIAMAWSPELPYENRGHHAKMGLGKRGALLRILTLVIFPTKLHYIYIEIYILRLYYCVVILHLYIHYYIRCLSHQVSQSNKYYTSILKGSDDGVLQSGQLSFWTLSCLSNGPNWVVPLFSTPEDENRSNSWNVVCFLEYQTKSKNSVVQLLHT